MRITYVGDFGSVTVCGFDGVDIEFPHGQVVEVPEDLGRDLVESPIFTKAETRGETKRAPARETAKER